MESTSPSQLRAVILRNLPQAGLFAVILALVGYLATRSPLVLQPATVAQIFKYYSPMAMLALGMTFIILTGGIDLSVGFTMMLLMFVIAAPLKANPNASPALVLLYGLTAGMGMGGILGAAVAYARIPAFIVSLALMVGAYGATLILSQNQSIGSLPETVMWLGKTEFSLGSTSFPIMMPFVIVSFLVASLVLGKTKYGRHLFAVGSNREAARLSGINVPRVEMTAYVISGLCCFAAAVMQLGINRNADPKVALSDNLELNAIAIVVIGGTSLTGGRGSIGGTALGALLLALIFNGLPLIGVTEPSYKKLIQGGIILIGAVLDAVQRRFGRS
jgi:ribose/xylose/arabinose/galactoside ABC-type transport system permease subunit